MLSINEYSDNSDVESFDLVVFKRKPKFFTDCAELPKIECTGWKCENSAQAINQLETKDIDKELDVQLIAHINVTTSLVRSGDRVSLQLPTWGINSYYAPDKPFAQRFASVDLTDFFNEMFARINNTVQWETNPGPAKYSHLQSGLIFV
jgi:hypothetical protein